MDRIPPRHVRRAEGLFHAAVGELGTERLLFGSGLDPALPKFPERQQAILEWFTREKPWLDPSSLELFLQENAKRLEQQLGFSDL